MYKKRPSKICVVCGLEKPLTSYLQITGPEGTSYGVVCATCRGSGLGKKITLPDFTDDQEDPSSSGLKIDAKTKIQVEKDKRELADKIEQDDRKEKTRKEEKETKTDAQKEISGEEDKRIREAHLIAKSKTGFMGYTPRNPENIITSAGAPITPGNVAQDNLTAQRIDEQRKTTESTQDPVLDPHTSTVSRENPFYRAWEDLLGNSVARRTTKRLFQTTGAQKTADKTAVNKNPAVEYVQETWAEPNPKNLPPGGRRR